MSYKNLDLDDLIVNPANDRHGELENETAAIARLFALRESHMRNLTRDLVAQGEVFEPPLVYPEGDKFVVADGNRRTTCLKLLARPNRAPTVELQNFYREQRRAWVGEFPTKLQCRVEANRDRVDEILFRRHTGTQSGVGQSTWDDRMKSNFVIRTGKGTTTNVADEIESRLSQATMAPGNKIPRSTLNRLLSAEPLRNRLGFSIKRGKFEYLCDKDAVHRALLRVTEDLSLKKVTLNDLWNAEKKVRYIDRLDAEGVLPSISDTQLPAPKHHRAARSKPSAPPRPAIRSTLIPQIDYGVIWTPQLHRARAIWEELQFRLECSRHPNAISVLLRVLIELSIENYLHVQKMPNVFENDKLGTKIVKISEHLHEAKKIDAKYKSIFRKAQNHEQLISTDTLNRYIHSPQFSPSPEHLKAFWDTWAQFIVLCLNA
ncbi:MAG: hypothetical protein J0H67_01570 [Rhodospirillales bacterium]|nr:hypothetical protein [Rhodospirillales bacterium]